MRTLVRVFLLVVTCMPSLLKAEKPASGDVEIFVDGNITTGCPSFSATFYYEAFGNPMDPYILEEWDFGDGNTSTEYSPTHIYTTEGHFTVQLVLTKLSGLKDTATNINFIHVVNSFDVNLGPDTMICTGSTIILDATVPGATGYMWEDGSNTAQVEKFMEGEYFVEVTKDGCVGKDTIYVSLGPVLTADFNYDFTAGCSPIATTFTEWSQSCTGTVNSWEWDFGDGNTSTEQNPVHNYSAPGDYLVTLSVKNTIGSTYATSKTITIEGAISPTVELGDDIQLCEFTSATLNATGTGTTFLWNTTATTSSISVSTAGKYYVRVESDGCSASDTVNVEIIPELKVDFTATKMSSCLPMKFKYTDKTVHCEGTIVSWYWNFGDGHTSTEQNPEHTFTTASQFPVRLTVMLDYGLSLDKMKKTVVTPMPFTVDLGPDTTICTGELLTLDAGIPGANYEWSTSETSEQIVVGFDDQYSVKVTYDGCEAKDTINVFTTSAAVINYGYEVQSQCLPVDVKFSDSTLVKCSQSIASWKWEFGDGNISNQQHPTYAYNAIGDYTVRLTITTSGGATTMTTKTVNITNTAPVVDIPAQLKLCEGTSGQLNAGINDATYSWSPATGLNNTLIKDPIVTPVNNGWYHVDVTKCMITVSDSIYVITDSINKPIITQSGNLLKTNDANAYEWYYDGEIITGAVNKSISIDKQGYYAVKVMNTLGCEKTSDTSFFMLLSGTDKDGVKILCAPNPIADGEFSVVFSVLPEKPAQVSIYDIKGIRMMTIKAVNHRNPINVRNLMKGMYLVEVVFDGKRKTIPIAIQ